MIPATIARKLIFKTDLPAENALSEAGLKPFLVPSRETAGVSAVYKEQDRSRLIIYCHGNGSHLDCLLHVYEFYQNLGYSFLVFDYPGYGETAGSASEQSCYAALEAVYDYAHEVFEYQPEQITLHGVSLGGAVAAWGAVQLAVRSVIIESSFTSIRAMARFRQPFLPIGWMLPDKFNTLARIPEIKIPILLIHGDEDETVPLDHSKQLFEKVVTEQKELKIIKGANHRSAMLVAMEEYQKTVKDFLSL